MTKGSEIKFHIDGPIGRLTLNNPRKINALSKQMIEEMIDVFTEIAVDERVKVIIIDAAGKHFCAGHYLAEMVSTDAKASQQIFDQCTRMMQLIHAIPQLVIAQVQGIATAAGCQLVAWCDLAVAEENAKFATPGVKIGLFCTTPMVALTRAIGRKAAMEMLMTGRYVSAAEAKSLGLINRVVAPERLASETLALAESIAEASGYVLANGKKSFYAQADQDDNTAYQYAGRTIAMNLLAHDAQTGIRAFLDKKKPVWQNR